MTEQNDEESMKVLFPSFNQASGECTVLVQIDPQDTSTLDFTGATGAIGRLEADDMGVSFDFKGVQYKGTFYPTATAVFLAVVNGKENYLKVDGIADDFCYLEKTGDALKKFDAQAVGDMTGYNIHDEDVNRNEKVSSATLHVERSDPHLEHKNAESQTLKGKRSISKKASMAMGSAPKKVKQKC